MQLEQRAAMFSAIRAYFSEKSIVEVDCPALSSAACIDAHIDVMQVLPHGYLHTSPEYGMKQLLSLGICDIYQMSHVFRAEEEGRLHRSEFMMIEWYRQGIAFEDFIEEVVSFTHLFLGSLPTEYLTYRQALQRYAGIDYVSAASSDLIACIKEHGIEWHGRIEDKDALLNLLMGCVVEPHLGRDALCVLSDYPASQAALAKTVVKRGEAVAERFEIYFQGIELANGYHELTDAVEQRRRLEAANQERIALGKQPLPIDEAFLEALERGLPDCCGVAAGFDRLLMLKMNSSRISDILP